MGLDLFPTPYPCTGRGYYRLDTAEEIDCDRTKCPFKDDNNPRAPFGTYCHFGGKWLSFELEALGFTGLSDRCYKSLTREKADKFGVQLLRLVARLRKRYEGVPPEKRPQGAGRGLFFDAKQKAWIAGHHSTLDEALATIETGGRWYRKVASLGSDVHARF